MKTRRPQAKTKDTSGRSEADRSASGDDGPPSADGEAGGEIEAPEDADDCRPISDSLIRDLTAHRTLGLRLALSEQPEVAIVATTHTLAAQMFYRGADAHVLDIRPVSTYLASNADGIEDTQAGKTWADRHDGWAAQMPRGVADLWSFIVELDHDSRMALFAHCVALTVNAVILPPDRRPRAVATANALAGAVSLDMTALWRPTVPSYLGRVTKSHILAAVREGVGVDAAERIADLKKHEMAEAAERLLSGTGWLPRIMTVPAAMSSVDVLPDSVDHALADAEDMVAAE